MAIILDVGEEYLLGSTVRIAVYVEFGDPPVRLPNNPSYRILRSGERIYTPTSDSGPIELKPGGHLVVWLWDQRNEQAARVDAGEYACRLLTADVGERERSFRIKAPRRWLSSLKASSKWAARACGVAGPFTCFFEPVTGAVISASGVALTALEKDPPSDSFSELVKVGDLLQDIRAQVPDYDRHIEGAEEHYPGMSEFATRMAEIHDYTTAIRITIERLQGAELADAEEHVFRQSERLQELCMEAQGAFLFLENSNIADAFPADGIDRQGAINAARESLGRWIPRPLASEYFDGGMFETAAFLGTDLPERLNRQTLSVMTLQLLRFSDQLAAIADMPLEMISDMAGMPA
ncbi:hypothetical protein [Inquilinus sp. CAU 1745]|uniref:hypothetical protein n=1 Tax=Inquilinus sp. CAU 1745 TaxID=3140369 RepID=UPI00325B11A6